MNKHVKRKWLRALKSGEYAKGKGSLAYYIGYGIPEYCCLGVLVCEMAPEFAREESNHILVGNGYDRQSYLPDDLAIMWGLDYDTQKELGVVNDNVLDFAPVIAYIETNL